MPRGGIDLPPEQRRVGYVFQDALLFPHMDVEANLLYGQRLRAPEDRFIDEARVVELLGLGALLHRKPQDAVRRRKAARRDRPRAARAAAHPAAWTSRSPRSTCRARPEILDYIERLRDELDIPIVYVSHSVTEITRLADTVVVACPTASASRVGDVDEVMGRLDLEAATGRYEAGSVLDTRVAAHDRPKIS